MKLSNSKYKQVFIIVGFVSILVICYLQQKELTKLRANNLENQYIIDSLTLASKQKDSLCNRYQWATDLYFVELHSDLTELMKFQRIFNEDYRQLEKEANGAN
jgi:hypothetical protein